jgi:hypothetical protein
MDIAISLPLVNEGRSPLPTTRTPFGSNVVVLGSSLTVSSRLVNARDSPRSIMKKSTNPKSPSPLAEMVAGCVHAFALSAV